MQQRVPAIVRWFIALQTHHLVAFYENQNVAIPCNLKKMETAHLSNKSSLAKVTDFPQ